MSIKHLLLHLSFCTLAQTGLGQNVGIGTLNPASPLHLVSTQANPLVIDGGSSMYSSIFETGIYRGYWGSFSGADADVDFGTGAGNSLGKLHLTIQSAPRLTIDATGNVGIGTQNPAVGFHIVNNAPLQTMRLDGGTGMHIGLFESGANRGYIGSFSGAAADVDFGTTGVNSTGKLHLTTQANPRLTIQPNGYVGIGTVNPAWPLDVNGGMQLGGRLYVSGSSGVTGQVLTSNGLAAPTWETPAAAYANNVRFSFVLSNNTSTNGDFTLTNRYNTNPAVVSISGTNITFNETGLYHFEGSASGRIDYAAPLSYNPSLALNMYINGGIGAGNNPLSSTDLDKSQFGNSYSNPTYFKADFYITAGQVLNLSFSYGSAPAGYTILDSFGYLRGYLISN